MIYNVYIVFISYVGVKCTHFIYNSTFFFVKLLAEKTQRQNNNVLKYLYLF